MPTISLRLTEEEHAALKAWAHDSRRSIQKEAVFRLFDATLSERGEAGTPPARSGDTAAAATAATPSGDGSSSGPRSLDVPRSESDEVKPDWKSGKK